MIYLLVHTAYYVKGTLLVIFFFNGWVSCVFTSAEETQIVPVNWQPALKIGEFRVLISLSTPSQLLWQHICSRMESALSHPYCSSFLLNCYTVDSRSFYAPSYLEVSEFWQKAVYPPQFTVTRELRQLVIVPDGSPQESWRGTFYKSREWQDKGE